MASGEFRTLKGYTRASPRALTESMEDYIEMIARLSADDGDVRVTTLSSRLHVRPSSSSKMVDKLKALGLVNCEKYGQISLTAKGKEAGAYLLWRHGVLCRFFCRLNSSEDELNQVEQIEHFITPDTVRNMEKWLGAQAHTPPQP